MLKRSVLRTAAATLALLCFAPPLLGQSFLEVQFIAVGQADATLVRCPNSSRYMLIDSGDRKKGGYPNSLEDFQAHLDVEFKNKPRKLEVAIASHAHADHMGSMAWVLKTFEVGTYVDNGDKGETDTFEATRKLRNSLAKKGKIEYVNAKQAKSTELGFCRNLGVLVEVFSPWAFSTRLSDANDKSVIVRLTYRNVSFLFVGDAHDKAEKAMMQDMGEELRRKLDVDVLKVGHHGSNTSSTAEFVLAVSPQMVVISSGRMNVGTNVRYKHPRANTIGTYADWFKQADQSRLANVKFPGGKVWAYDTSSKKWRQVSRPNGVWLTTVDGTIVVRTDGDKLTVAASTEQP